MLKKPQSSLFFGINQPFNVLILKALFKMYQIWLYPNTCPTFEIFFIVNKCGKQSLSSQNALLCVGLSHTIVFCSNVTKYGKDQEYEYFCKAL